MPIPVYQVDAFTEKPFAGNPAAVCFLSGPAAGEWMKDVAAEMNLPETAFLPPLEDGFEWRWFTPTVEVGLCGHATLASAHALWESGRLAAGWRPVSRRASIPAAARCACSSAETVCVSAERLSPSCAAR